MLYFAYGSNLNHQQMKKRCKDSKFIKFFFLDGYKLSFCAINQSYGFANIIKESNSKVPGGIWEISLNDERELDYYEGFPIRYDKDFFLLNRNKVMYYIIKRQYLFKPPKRMYIDIINQGYKDCNIDTEYLKKKLKQYNIDL